MSKYKFLGKMALLVSTSGLLLTGCGGGSSSNGEGSDHRHTDTEVESAGRLVLYDQDNAALKVLDLSSGRVLDSHPITGEAPRLYASPGQRFAVILQRTEGLVSFLDSGLYVEDHGDHMHEYAEDPSMLNFSLNGSRPTHYTVHADHAAIFNDAQAGLASSVMLLSEAGISAGQMDAELGLTNNMHGVAKLVGDRLFVTYRDPSIIDTTLPAAVERYQYAGGVFSFEQRYEEPCPGLHGSAATDRYVVFGCSDGVLMMDLTQPGYPASKLGNPASLLPDARIGSVYSHHDVNEFVGVAGSQFYVMDMTNAADPYQELVLPVGVSRVSQGFNATGTAFYILGDDGNLYLYDVQSDWTAAPAVAVTEAVTTDVINPVVAVAFNDDRLYVLNTHGESVAEVNSVTGATIRTLALDFTASNLVWLGLHEQH
ncbi:MAG: hypothetical protein VYA55_20130 [Pseudomonadota bacterium]|nr:hypothetical protein [Pseudomonadota bacterium]